LVLEASPVDRRAQDGKHAIDGRDRPPLAILSLEAGDLPGLLEYGYRQLPVALLELCEVAADGVAALEPFCLHIVREVLVEEVGHHGHAVVLRLHRRIGIPLTRSGRQRKIGALVGRVLFGWLRR